MALQSGLRVLQRFLSYIFIHTQRLYCFLQLMANIGKSCFIGIRLVKMSTNISSMVFFGGGGEFDG